MVYTPAQYITVSFVLDFGLITTQGQIVDKVVGMVAAFFLNNLLITTRLAGKSIILKFLISVI